MTKLQSLLITLFLACLIHSKILVLDTQDLRMLSASKNPNLLRSLFNTPKTAHKERVCVGSDGARWVGMFDERNHVCRMFMCFNQLTSQPNDREVECVVFF